MGKPKHSRGNKQEVLVNFRDERGRWRERAVPGKELGWEWQRQGKQLLVLPTTKARWDGSLRRWRSALLREARGRYDIVSLGLPKFWDPEHDAAGVAALEEEAASGEQLTASVKHDGRLLIRSVHADRVLWRTRSSFGVEDGLRAALATMTERHPLLDNPAWQPQASLQLELCLRKQRIVVAYPEDRLVLVGASSHETLAPLQASEIADIAAEAGLEAASTWTLTGTSLAEWRQQLQQLDDDGEIGEGIVVRDQRGWPRLRMKTERYARAFRLRYDYPPGALAKAWERESGRRDGDAITDAVLDSLKVAENDRDEVRRRLAEIAQLRPQAVARISELAASTEGVDTSTRAAIARHAKELGELEGPALLRLHEGDVLGATQMLEAHATNRLCERLDAETVIIAAP